MAVASGSVIWWSWLDTPMRWVSRSRFLGNGLDVEGDEPSMPLRSSGSPASSADVQSSLALVAGVKGLWSDFKTGEAQREMGDVGWRDSRRTQNNSSDQWGRSDAAESGGVPLAEYNFSGLSFDYSANGNVNYLSADENWSIGESVVLTYSYAREGAPIYEYNQGWQLVGYSSLLDASVAAYGSFDAVDAIVAGAFGQISELSGIQFIGLGVEDNVVAFPSYGGVGQGDIRLAGYDLGDGVGGTLAYGYYPPVSDTVVDIVGFRPGGILSPSYEWGLYNTIQHEVLHNLGFGHVEQSQGGGDALMEPSLNTNIAGLQYDDILGLQRVYGDANEKGVGNDDFSTAVSLGLLSGSFSLGVDGNGSSLSPGMVDFVSLNIKNNSIDLDFYSFSLDSSSSLELSLRSLGFLYANGFDSSRQIDMGVNLYSSSRDLLANVNGVGLGLEETWAGTLGAGNYYLGIYGDSAVGDVQAYQLDLSITPEGGDPPPEPTYSIVAPTQVDEGARAEFVIQTANVLAGARLYWSIGGDVNGNDFSNLSGLTGEVVVGADGTAQLGFDVAADLETEGSERLELSLFTDVGRSNVVAQASVGVIDTSVAPPPELGEVIWGTTSSDSLTGTSGHDQMSGVLAEGTSRRALGYRQRDRLTGADGVDTFLVGDERGGFYLSGSRSRNATRRDYVTINDFGVEDKLQLASVGTYFTSVSGGDLWIYFDTNNNSVLELARRDSDDAVARLVGVTELSNAQVVWA